MPIKKIKQSWQAIKFVLSDRKYFFIALGFGLAVFALLYYFLVATINDNSLRIAIVMSGAGYIAESLISIFIMSALFGIYASLLAFKISHSVRAGKKGGFLGALGGTIGAFGVGCPTCGAVLFSLLGTPLALMYLPFRGAELRVLGILFLAAAVYFVANSLNGKCRVK